MRLKVPVWLAPIPMVVDAEVGCSVRKPELVPLMVPARFIVLPLRLSAPLLSVTVLEPRKSIPVPLLEEPDKDTGPVLLKVAEAAS